MLRTIILSLVLFLALMPTGSIKMGAVQSNFQKSPEAGPFESPVNGLMRVVSHQRPRCL